MAYRDNWLQVATESNKTIFDIKQRKNEPLIAWVALVSSTVLCVFLAYICGEAHGQAAAGFALLFGLIAFALGLMAVAGTFILLPAGLFRKPRSRFSVSPDAVFLDVKNVRSYPEKIDVKSISGLFVGPIQKGVTISVTVDRSRIAEAGRSAGEGVAAMLGSSNYFVAINSRGKEIALAKHLSSPEAEHLCDEVRKALGWS